MTSESLGTSRLTLAAAVAAAILASADSAATQSLETLVDFQCSTVGCAPNGVFFQARDGYFYGTTSEGDAWPGADGTVFRMDREGGIEVLIPSNRFFFQASDGFFYGTTTGDGASEAGTVFRMDATGAVTELHAFDGVLASSAGPLVEAGRGVFYGIAGTPQSDAQRLFRMDANGSVRLLRTFGEPIGGVRTLIAAGNQSFYGTTYGGVVFRANRNGQMRVLHSFPTVYLDLMAANDGHFYGATIDGGAHGAGMIFRMTRSGKVTVLHSFGASPGDGASPYQAPIEGADGFFYGTTGMGGAHGVGTVYRMDSAGRITILHSFGGTERSGAYPVGELEQGDDGALYGTTAAGGLWDHGTVFRLRLGV